MPLRSCSVVGIPGVGSSWGLLVAARMDLGLFRYRALSFLSLYFRPNFLRRLLAMDLLDTGMLSEAGRSVLRLARESRSESSLAIMDGATEGVGVRPVGTRWAPNPENGPRWNFFPESPPLPQSLPESARTLSKNLCMTLLISGRAATFSRSSSTTDMLVLMMPDLLRVFLAVVITVLLARPLAWRQGGLVFGSLAQLLGEPAGQLLVLLDVCLPPVQKVLPSPKLRLLPAVPESHLLHAPQLLLHVDFLCWLLRLSLERISRFSSSSKSLASSSGIISVALSSELSGFRARSSSNLLKPESHSFSSGFTSSFLAGAGSWLLSFLAARFSWLSTRWIFLCSFSANAALPGSNTLLLDWGCSSWVLSSSLNSNTVEVLCASGWAGGAGRELPSGTASLVSVAGVLVGWADQDSGFAIPPLGGS
ncbi:hypothetical protein E2C01_030218 [Portunus trituberculatus]|uniref:Uncharacterized protein n=1 Tax=Portunus trituberculatus TaxID=210409 RepID=A0A5B7EQB8_PORTR|nr:hypothetical protein [Portunus trituberculatus]